MAYRPDANLIEGILDNTRPGRVTGWVDFFREAKEPIHCRIVLDGDFHDEIRGRILHVWNDQPADRGFDGSLARIDSEYMESMDPVQQGEVGDITILGKGGLSIEWYSRSNGRVVLSVPSEQFQVLGTEVDLTQLPPRRTHPGQFESYMREIAVAFRRNTKNPTATILSVGAKGVRNADDERQN